MFHLLILSLFFIKSTYTRKSSSIAMTFEHKRKHPFFALVIVNTPIIFITCFVVVIFVKIIVSNKYNFQIKSPYTVSLLLLFFPRFLYATIISPSIFFLFNIRMLFKSIVHSRTKHS